MLELLPPTIGSHWRQLEAVMTGGMCGNSNEHERYCQERYREPRRQVEAEQRPFAAGRRLGCAAVSSPEEWEHRSAQFGT